MTKPHRSVLPSFTSALSTMLFCSSHSLTRTRNGKVLTSTSFAIPANFVLPYRACKRLKKNMGRLMRLSHVANQWSSKFAY